MSDVARTAEERRHVLDGNVAQNLDHLPPIMSLRLDECAEPHQRQDGHDQGREGGIIAAQRSPRSAAAGSSPDELRHLDRSCQRAMADPGAEPSADERPAVEHDERLLDGWGHAWRYAERGR